MLPSVMYHARAGVIHAHAKHLASSLTLVPSGLMPGLTSTVSSVKMRYGQGA